MCTSKSLKAWRSYHWSLDHTRIHLLLIRFQNQDYVMMPFSWATTLLCFLCSWYPTNTYFIKHITFAWDLPAYTENRTGTLGNMLPQAWCCIYPAWAMASAGCASQPQVRTQEIYILSCFCILHFSLHGVCLLTIITILKCKDWVSRWLTQKADS